MSESIRPGPSSLPPSNFLLSHHVSPPMEAASYCNFFFSSPLTHLDCLHLDSLSFSSSSLLFFSVSPVAILSGTGSVGLLFSSSAHRTTTSVCRVPHRISPLVSPRSTPCSSFLISPWCLGLFDRFHRLHHWLESSRFLEKYDFSPPPSLRTKII